MKRLVLMGAVTGLALAAGLAAQAPNDWPTVGNDPGGMKYSSLTQITPANVSKLAKAWTYDMGVPASGYTITPIVVSNVMYFPVQGSIIVALKADSGTELWKCDLTKIPDLGANPSAGGRGIWYWPGTTRVAPRIVIATTSGFIVQLDAKSGKPIPGPAGVINLSTGVMEKFGGAFSTNMPPALYKNLAIVAGRTGEQGRYGIPGDPRGFDLLTGKEVWRFHVVPRPGEENFGTWGLEGWQDRRGPGVWVPMTIDPVNDLVFIALGNATDQNYGGSRPGENLYATSLLVLQASTGRRKWHFQMTHHDIYDWDLASPPALIEATKDGKRLPAVAQMTKQGLLFMFDRLTGEPLFGVEERPVPRFDAPGDEAWPTQPFPVKPSGLTRDGMTRKEVSKISPEAEKYLHGSVRQVREHGALYAVRHAAEPGVSRLRGRWRMGRRLGQSGARPRLREYPAPRRHWTIAVEHVFRCAPVVWEAESADDVLYRSAGLSLQRSAVVGARRGELDDRRHRLAHSAG